MTLLLRKPLEESFDVVHIFPKGQNGFQIDATILALSLVFYKKLIILPSSSLVNKCLGLKVKRILIIDHF
jgi:hypothetical protein